ncbi:electron transfer flavoprotein subunit alpha/FixB family protein [Clostridium formicaceticum]|uniref:Acryloyl-CoA reductase electron transfer subunit beta n=1 Tax=Clostridium formicaceticum TaxID=1497 RepID=A0AAC9RIU4_9CLOT|nr:electron transfer flavoprotein subunit alpha/FixB family protein [Clostridium formicaceticum]AOY75777.1 electron transfer flavoprotein, alpha subunit [Clostridium formicaceticum]ARE86103.1 Acryloyl-CoA reductase electron transfer subunit beta [Clostridium formicaceticum]
MTEKTHRGILVFAEQKDGRIHKVTYELLNKGRTLAESLEVPVYAIALGPKNMEVEELIYRGADEVFYGEEDAFNQPDELLYKENIVALINRIKPEICLFGATTFGRSLAPRVAGSLETGLTADCTELKIDEDGKLIQIRPAFSDNILAHIKTKTYPQMATIRYKEFSEAKRDGQRQGKITKIEAILLENPAVRILKQLQSNEIDISEAEVVVAGGRGLKSSEDFHMLKELAALLGGVVGASRAVVEEDYISSDHQVGYSGNRVKPKLYIACGISGAPQHLAGMREAENIVAINTDPSAPIFNIADVGIVGDLYEVIPMLINKINNQKAKLANA